MASGSGTFGISITATDHASGVIDKINKQLASMRAPVDRLESSFKKFADVSGLKAVANAFGGIMRSIESAALSMARFIPMIGMLTGGGIIAGLIAVTIHTATYARSMQLAAFQTGENVMQLQNMRKAAELAGVSGDALTESYKNLGQAMLAARLGENNEVAVMAQAFGIKSSDSDEAVLRKLLPRLAKMDPRVRQRVERDFGIEALDPMVMEYAQGKLSADELIARQSHTMTPKELQDADEVRRQGIAIKQKAEGEMFKVLADAAPQLSKSLAEINKCLDVMIGHLDKLLADNDPINKLLANWKIAFEALGVALSVSLLPHLFKVGEALAKLIGVTATPEGAAFLAALGIILTPGDQAVGPQPKEPMTNWLGENSPIGQRIQRFMHRWLGTGTAEGSGDIDTGLTGSTSQTPAMRALLDTISGTEGADYNSRVGEARGHGTLNLNGPHPDEVAGRYQFLRSTWLEGIRALHLPDVMSKENQDKVAEWLVRERAGVTDEMLNDPKRRQEVIDRLKGTWVSFPGGSQQTTNLQNFNKLIDNALAREQGRSDATLPTTASPPQNGKISIDVSHSGAQPPGFSMNIRPSGDLFGVPGTGQAMPAYGP